MKKALIYLRVSDQMQEEKDSLKKQEEQAIIYCELKGYTIYKVIKEVGSGRKDDRSGFLELEREIEANSFDILVFYELSRLSRNSYMLHKLTKDLKIKNIQYESITETFLNSDNPGAKIMFSIMATLAESESDMISKRVKARMYYYVSQGYWLFPSPRGYRLKDRMLYVVEEEAQMVRDIYNDFLTGSSYSELCRKYNLSHPGVKRVLTNVLYIGKTKFGFEGKNKNTGKRVQNLSGEIFEGKHEAIIDEATFYSVGNMIKEQKEKKLKTTRSTYLLTGLIRHNNCERKMYGKYNKKSKYSYYQCSSCNFSMSLKLIDETVITNLKEYSKGLNTLKSAKTKKKDDSKKELTKLTNKRKRILETYTDGYLAREDYLSSIKVVDDKIKKLEEAKEQVPDPVVVTNYDKLLKIVKKFDKLDIQEKKALMRIFIDEVRIVDRETIEVVYKI